MPSFYIPLSGLNADSTALNTIANNLSNMNTTGFKAQKTNFSDLFYQEVGTTGSGDEIQVGTGVQVASNSTDFTGGSVSSTGVATDAAIDGTGFFVLDAGNGSLLYTRNGHFQTSSDGTLESTQGQAVMGYMAVNGVINTGTGLSDLTIPTGQVMQPAATTSFSMTQNLDSTSKIGAQATGQVKVYDSLGKSYEATVTYTNLGNNKWSYAITVPDTLSAAATTAAAAATMSLTATLPTATSVTAATTAVEPATTVPNPVTAAAAVTAAASTPLAAASATPASTGTTILAANTAVPGTIAYTFAPTGTVSGSTVLRITDGTNTCTVTPSVADESLSAFASDINTALAAALPGAITATATGTNGVAASNTNGTLSITGAGISVVPASSSVRQDVALTTTNYNFTNSNGSLATVDPSTNLTIQIGSGSAVAAPAFSAGETVAQYAAALQAAVGPASTSGVTVSGAGGVLSITGPANMTISGGVTQDFSATKLNYSFGSYTDPATGLTTQAAVDPSTNLTITALNKGGVSTTVTVKPSNAAGETVAQYAIDLNNALTAGGITGVTATSSNGVLSLAGPSAMTVGGYVNEQILGTTVSSSVTPTSPVTTTATATLPAATLTPASTSTTTLGAAAPVSAAASGILAADSVTAPSVANSTLTANTSVPGTIAYTFAPTGTVSGNTVLRITDGTNTCTVTPSVADESLSAFANDINTQLAAALPGAITATATGTNGVSASNTNGTLSIAGAGISVVATPAGVQQDVAEATTSYHLVNSNGSVAQVGPSTNLAIKLGGGAAVSAPASASSMSLSAYATALQNAVGAPAVSGVTVTANAATGLLSITGPANMTISNNLVQDFTGKSIGYSFGATGTVDPATNLTITGPTTSGGTATIGPLVVTQGETVANYVAALNTALGNANVTGVSVINNGGQVSIVGPSSMVVANTLKEDVALTTTNYNFVTSNGSLANVAPSTTLAISEAGGAAVSVPAFSSSQSVATYAANLQAALTSAGITDVTVSAASGQLSITGPANMAITGNVNQAFTGAQTSFDFGSYTDPNTGLTAQATVAPTASLTISGPTTSGGSTTITVAPSNPAGESVAQYALDVQNALAAAKITGVTVTAANGILSLTGPDTVTIAGTMNQDMLGTTSNYAFETNATVDPTTNLRITGQTSTGGTATIVAPTVSTGETVSQYAAALTAALSTAGITNVAVTSSNGQLSITGANLSTTGSIKQGLADTTINYDFGSTATVNPATNLTIVGPTVSGTPPTAITVAPTVTAGETVAQYAADLTKALKNAGIDTGPNGVSVTATGGQLTIVGPAATLKTAGIASQDLTATTISYNFGLSSGTIATVDPKTNLTITGQTASGATATTLAPTITLGETVAQYVNALNDALTSAGIAGVTVTSTAGGQLSITGANLSTSGSVIQDPVSSANANGTLTFDSSGNLVNPSASLNNITFTGLSDAAAPMNMTWNLFGANGSGQVSQTAVASAQSAQLANGYAAGNYQDFTIGSDGTITAKYSNGENQVVGQIGLAKVSNLQGLVDVGSTQYRTTTASGSATVGVAGTGGLGTLEGSSLEASNVNISQEFSQLIIAQRAFEANSKAVTTFDTVTQETINMIH